VPYALVVGAYGVAALVVIWARQSNRRWIAVVEHPAWTWIILGVIAGFIANRILYRHGQGLWLDIALGIVGALVGGFLFDQFGPSSGVFGLNIYSTIVATVGAIVALLIYEGGTKRRHLTYRR
jgi:uncharacterized membrane protein YeaQ/YmgE (transglycosylase-associated protein family)